MSGRIKNSIFELYYNIPLRSFSLTLRYSDRVIFTAFRQHVGKGERSYHYSGATLSL